MRKTPSFRFVRTSFVALAAVAAVCFMAQDVNAQGYGYGGSSCSYQAQGQSSYYGGYTGGYGRGLNVQIGTNRGYGGYGSGLSLGYSSYRPNYSYSRPVWHDTTHLDYHRPMRVRDGNHYDYVPGHYDVHRTGHYHR